MNDQKPDTPLQRNVDEIVRQDASNRAQKTIDSAVSEMEKGQSTAESLKQNSNIIASQGAKAAYDAELATKLAADPEKCKHESQRAQEHAEVEKAQHKDASPTSPAPGTMTPEEDNSYYNGMSQ